MRISEIFYSIQGEGPEIGKKSIFIRLTKCNLACQFCDTPYALHNGKRYSISNLIKIIKSQKLKQIVWTGGEPTLQIKELIRAINKLKDYSHDIETNGTTQFPVRLFNTIVISPKKQAINKKLIRKYKNYKNVYFKFVVNNLKEYKFWKSLSINLELPKNKVYFMPQAISQKQLINKSKWLIGKTKEDGFNFSTRLQILKNFR